jgi:hypothetical protein
VTALLTSIRVKVTWTLAPADRPAPPRRSRVCVPGPGPDEPAGAEPPTGDPHPDPTDDGDALKGSKPFPHGSRPE